MLSYIHSSMDVLQRVYFVCSRTHTKYVLQVLRQLPLRPLCLATVPASAQPAMSDTSRPTVQRD